MDNNINIKDLEQYVNWLCYDTVSSFGDGLNCSTYCLGCLNVLENFVYKYNLSIDIESYINFLKRG